MTKKGDIIFYINNYWEAIPYIVIDIDGYDFCSLIKISPTGDNYNQRISVAKKNIKNNCFDEAESGNLGEYHQDLAGDLVHHNKTKINKWIEKRKKECEEK